MPNEMGGALSSEQVLPAAAMTTESPTTTNEGEIEQQTLLEVTAERPTTTSGPEVELRIVSATEPRAYDHGVRQSVTPSDEGQDELEQLLGEHEQL